jgi:hypothetical protein
MIVREIQRFAPLASTLHFAPRVPRRGRLSASDRAALAAAARDFALRFRRGFAFAALCELGAVVLNQPVSAADLGHCFWNCVRCSCDIAAHPFAHSAALVLLKPDVSSLVRWLPFAAATSLAAAAAVRAVDTATVNWERDGRVSLRGWADGAAAELAQRAGFHTALGAADRLLPPAARMGGRFPREAAALSAATLAEMTIGGRLGGGWRQVLGNASATVATAFLETGLFRAVENALIAA